jgi:uncharacterized membrane protein
VLPLRVHFEIVPPMESAPSSSPFPVPGTPAPPESPPPGGWAVAAGSGAQWWSEGWRLFVATPWIWLAITLAFAAIMLALAFIPFVGQLASTLLYPVLAGGVLLGARAVDRGEPLTVGTLFACFDRRFGPLLLLSLLYFAGWLVVSVIAVMIIVGGVGLGTLSAILTEDALQSGIAALGALGATAVVMLLVGVVLGIPLLMAYWFAPALVVLRGDEPLAAMNESFRANLRNIPPLTIYGLIGIGLAIVASIPFLLGWLVLAPVFATSVYASYKDIFGDADMEASPGLR